MSVILLVFYLFTKLQAPQDMCLLKPKLQYWHDHASIFLNIDFVSHLFQCQKFGEYHKDDPSSFRFSETFSLYPQVSLSIGIEENAQ